MSQNRNVSERLENAFPNIYTISNLIFWAKSILQKSNIDSPRLDAEIILSHILHCKRIDLYVHPDRVVEDTVALTYKNAIQKRAWRVPLQYITNHEEFMSMDFYVDERVLIPRQETELLVEAVIKKLQSTPRNHEIIIVDIGVGSGNIAITLAKKIENARIFAIDISPDALEVANINARRHQVLDKIIFLCGDIYKPLEGYKLESKVDVIVSNPPYIATDEFHILQEEVRRFEPYNALVSGRNGLQMFCRILKDAHAWLKPGGFIAMEVGEKQAQKVAQLIEDRGCFQKPELIKDYQHIYRIVISKRL
ncbi:MAG: peptide chain release factor N(5)-glutamine methyltransferase [wastewater metagenome]|nr:peptide chain release factor N(5)-glutamine methyltransferase [Candidatus Loosdrechtia aerotolerans]